ncbi:MAG: hypothetical protein ACRDOJ_03775 [Nocardioidaceae bacterium]
MLRSRGTYAVLAGVLVVVGSVVAVSALATGDAPQTATFNAVVTRFADDGALMCVRDEAKKDAPAFCDVYFVPPGTPEITVGDRVTVSTIRSTAEDGFLMSGMLVQPIAALDADGS